MREGDNATGHVDCHSDIHRATSTKLKLKRNGTSCVGDGILESGLFYGMKGRETGRQGDRRQSLSFFLSLSHLISSLSSANSSNKQT